MSIRLPTAWTAIAVYSASDRKFIPLPGAPMTEADAYARGDVVCRTAKDRGRSILQIKAK
ncbi:hypothetical protein AA103196_3125 [Ameyamaea chiangmaiensis NBRC 103196]|nr:hypothetical protein AA103196_3125 [Ameyamaea chiangmaiensis NBRC 103196]